MYNTKHLCTKSIEVARERECAVILQTPEKGKLSLTQSFQDTDSSKSSMTNTEHWIKNRHKTNKLYGHIETKNWDDFDQKLNRLLIDRKNNEIYIEYEGHITNIDNIMRRAKDPKALLSSLTGDTKGGDVICQNDEYTIGFPCITREDGHFVISLPFVENANPTILQSEGISELEHEVYHDQFEFLNN